MLGNVNALRRLLVNAPRESLPMTYQQAAAALALKPPGTIAQITQALEQLMREDAEQGRHFIAALVVSRRGESLPAKGFFELAVALGRFHDEPAQHEVVYREEFQRALYERENHGRDGQL